MNTPIHDDLQNILKIDTRGVDPNTEPRAEAVPDAAPGHAPTRRHRA
ncbi:hypothetical protein [Rhodococcus sp. H29-C3]|nr:hypothetical protein [Rhodococcus sp. H29-C3]MDJ0362765.1 hypothetical protein [Rhodococcus sp. H29-C3]